MRNNNTTKRVSANGTKRTSTSKARKSISDRGFKGTKQDKPVRKRSYSADEGSVKGHREEKSFSRGFSKPSSGRMGSKSKRFGENEEKEFKPKSGKRFDEKRGEGKRGESKRIESKRNGGFKRDDNKKFGAKRNDRFETKRNTKNHFEDNEDRYFEEREKRPARPKALSYTPKPRQPKGNGEEGVRLNKYIANSGICSRREADDYITAGLVSVNGVIITELGTKVYSNDVVKFNNERIKGEEKVYILMNKPKDYVTTVSDPHAEKTVINLIEGRCAERVFPVGRLDKATTGVLLLTNDGDLAEKLTHPSFEKKKIYHVFLTQNFKSGDFNKLLEGIHLEDGFIQADTLSYIDEDKSQIGIEIHSGRNRIVRRVFEHLGYKIKKLDRVYFAGLTKKNLRRGQWRFLTDQEIAMLKMGSFE